MLRSCHRTRSRFFQNDLSIETRGHFYFVDDNTPTLPFPHDFYSATWTVGDWPLRTGTGPIQNATRNWTNGSLQITNAPGKVIGTAAQFDGGLQYPRDVNTATLRAGIPETCWTNFGRPFLAWDLVRDLNNCCLRAAYFQIISALYWADFDRIDDFFLSWLGPSVILTHFPEAGTFPAMTIAVNPAYTMVFISGTTQYQQWALQGFSGLQGPSLRDGVRTVPLWFDLSVALLNALETAGSLADQPILLVGHSYGAAAACVLAIRLRQAKPDREISLLTCGLPKPTDAAGIEVLRTVEARHVFNVGDIIPQVPLAVYQGAWFPLIVSLPLRFAWGQWESPSDWLQQTADGTRSVGPLPGLTEDVLFPLVVRVLGGLPIGIVTPHIVDEYVRRTLLYCSCPKWPIDDVSWPILFADFPAAGAIVLADVQPSGGRVGLVGLIPASAGLGLCDKPPVVDLLGLTALPLPTGSLGLCDAPFIPPSALVLASVNVSEGSLGLCDPPTSCPFCGPDPMPTTMEFTVSCPAIPDIDGNVYTLTRFLDGDVCVYKVEGYETPGGILNITVSLDPLDGPLVKWDVNWQDDLGPLWYMAATYTGDFVCSPFYAAGTGTIYEDGAPPGEDIAFSLEP